MNESQVPSFLLNDVSGSSNDRQALISDLQRLALWREVHGSEPYNPTRAVELQKRLCAQHLASLRKESEKTAIERARVEKEAVNLHRGIVEFVFSVEILGNPDEVNTGEIGWNTQIKDKITGETVGTPRTLMNQHVTFEWRTDTDARVNLEQYLKQVKQKYDDYSYGFYFRRANLSLGSRWSRCLTFEIRLFWRSIGIGSRTRKKIHALVSKHKK